MQLVISIVANEQPLHSLKKKLIPQFFIIFLLLKLFSSEKIKIKSLFGHLMEQY